MLEYRVKAAFLLNFTKFVEWPPRAFASDRSPISVCILGEDPFGRTLDQTMEGESVDARRLIVQRLQNAPSPGSCQVLFVGRGAKDVPSVLAGVGPGVLTVGEGDEFLHDSGIIAFVIDNRRVTFDINQAAAEKSGMKMSAKLLNVARTVER